MENIRILYEDGDCVVVDKPPGLMVHDDGRSKGPFLADWMARYPGISSVGEPARAEDGSVLARPGIVHRLDRETSGALIMAKTAGGHADLKKQFQDRTIAKKYAAFVWGGLAEEFGTIDRPIGRNKNDFRKWSAAGRGRKGESREAETYWTRLWTGRAPAGGRDGRPEAFSLIMAEPKTGRTHQIRVHFLAIHHPVVGDKLYAENKPYALGFGRLALHSRSLEFRSPETGKRVSVTAPFPADFVGAFETAGIELPAAV